MKSASFSAVLFALAILASAGAQAQTPLPAPTPTPTRGQLLYDNHCVSCHTQQVHWRQTSKVHNWNELRGEVTRWQATAGLGWSQNDITQVARYLNDTIYRMPSAGGVAKRE